MQMIRKRTEIPHTFNAKKNKNNATLKRANKPNIRQVKTVELICINLSKNVTANG